MAGNGHAELVNLAEFGEDALNTFSFLGHEAINPFVPVVYSFQAASQIEGSMVRAYGQWPLPPNGRGTARLGLDGFRPGAS